jgi:hypothetical protein
MRKGEGGGAIRVEVRRESVVVERGGNSFVVCRERTFEGRRGVKLFRRGREKHFSSKTQEADMRWLD